ncbi:MAG TPA: ROK family protein [Planctomycetota bacterium]|nr:ROK family protein [Planctomycetota bacterium]
MSDSFRILAFDIGGTHGRCALARCTQDSATPFEFGEVSSFKRTPGADGPAWLAVLLDGAKKLCAKKVRYAAVSFGGPVAPDGRIQSTHVPGWERVDLSGELARAFDLGRGDIVVENDANAGALGEFHWGAGRGCRDMLFFTVSTGIGGGVILDGKLRRGAHGLAGEFGHMIMDGREGAPQYAAGKPGALEALASGPAMEREGRAALEKVRAGGPPAPQVISAKNVFDAAVSGEPWAVEARARCVGELGRGIAAAMSAYDVERVVIGGGVSLAGDALFVPLRAAVQEYLPTFMSGKVEVVPAELGDRAQLYGAVTACLTKVKVARQR